MLEVEDHHLSNSDASDTMNFWDNLVNIYEKLSSSLKTFLLRLQVRRTLKGVFLCAACLAYCWSQKQNDQVIANASLFEN